MEQTNLVVTPDGKSWDEVTRDVSYLGPSVSALVSRNSSDTGVGVTYVFDEYRGTTTQKDYHTKGIAIGYDRLIFLEDGYYELYVHIETAASGGAMYTSLYKNGTTILNGSVDPESGQRGTNTLYALSHFARGDWTHVVVGGVAAEGEWLDAVRFNIRKVN